jgi:hypothetical protein
MSKSECLRTSGTIFANIGSNSMAPVRLSQATDPSTLFDSKIRVNTKAKSAPSIRQTIFEYEHSKTGRGTEDFTALAAEFLCRLKEREQPLARAANG